MSAEDVFLGLKVSMPASMLAAEMTLTGREIEIAPEQVAGQRVHRIVDGDATKRVAVGVAEAEIGAA